MSWLPLSDRLNQLPLILAGPILRRTEPDAVTVWVALREPSEVTLKVYSTENGNGLAIASMMLEGVRSTIAVGKHLHIVAVTAKASDDCRLESGQIYAYDLNFVGGDRTVQNLQQALHSAFLPLVPISYFDHQLPTFALPPKELNKLQIVHGSCRKPHGEGQDALAILDGLIEHNAYLPDARPHQLFFTGDQIYGDDVADPLLLALTEAGDTLLGWEENLPIVQPHLTTYLKPKQLKPGQRSQVAEEGGLTAGLRNQAELAKSHLFSFGEYCAVYLFLWSQTLWSDRFPRGQDVCEQPKLAKLWDNEVRLLKGFVQTLWKVRRALANVPTYMIFDDHDISDDWYLNQAWCLRVLGKPLGRSVVRNGLLAYAVFQAWGNTADQFSDGQSGEKLLTTVKNWSLSAGTDNKASDAIAQYLGLPDSEPSTGLPKMRLDGDVLILDRDRSALNWHYTIRSHCHEVVVLDTRTWRGYPAGKAAVTAPPRLLSPTAFERQIREPLKQSSDLLAVEGNELKKVGSSSVQATIVIAPTNLFSLRIIDLIQHWALKQHKVYKNDVGDGWNVNKVALAKLLVTLFERRDRVVILSGDIHYGSAICLNHWSLNSNRHVTSPLSADQYPQPRLADVEHHVLTQLTSSALKNSEWKTRLVHTKVKSLLPERSRIWIGWDNPPQLVESPMSQGRSWIRKFLAQGRSLRKPQNLQENLMTAWAMNVSDRSLPPDWQCRLEWTPRQIAQTVPWKQTSSLKSSNRSQTRLLNQIIDLFKMLWRNRWLQEGKEVIGVANIGVVSFNGDNAPKAVIHDLYWYPPWQQNSIVYSRFYVSLQLEDEI